jgi:sarcosine oxidase
MAQGGPSPQSPASSATYDAIVVGLGAMGSAAAYHLARRGRRVLGLEAFPRGHTFGSSHGETRIIRLAYFEHPNYVPLVRRAYTLWEALQREAGTELLRPTGGLFVGPPEGTLVSGSLRSARVHGLPHEVLDAAEVRRRYPALRPGPADVALYEPQAGILFPERCIDVHLHLAAAAGAELRHEEPVRRWAATASGVEVETNAGRYTTGWLVLTAGAWLGKLLADLRLPLQPERIPIFWMHPRESPELFNADRFPVWIWEAGDLGYFYGCPHVEWAGVKVGRHHSGEPCDPATVDRQVRPGDEARARQFLARCIPALDGPTAGSRVCLYTNTPDEHFVVDRHPGLPSVLFAGGFSGHGFKFAPVVGEILADLVTKGAATPAADFVRAARFAVRPPG